MLHFLILASSYNYKDRLFLSLVTVDCKELTPKTVILWSITEHHEADFQRVLSSYLVNIVLTLLILASVLQLQGQTMFKVGNTQLQIINE